MSAATSIVLGVGSYDARKVAIAAARNMGRARGWTPAQLQGAIAAVEAADPAGLDAFATAPDWWKAIGDSWAAAGVFDLPGGDELSDVVIAGASGDPGATLSGSARSFAEDVARDLRAAGGEAAKIAQAAGRMGNPKSSPWPWLAAAGVVGFLVYRWNR